MKDKVENGQLGASFEHFLEEQGIAEDVRNTAVKRVIAWQLTQAMQEQGIRKTEMAKRLQTSRAQLDRLLDPENDSVTLGMLTRVARAIGRTIRLELG